MNNLSLEEIYTAYSSKVMGYISARVKNHADVEDLCTDVFMKVQRKLPEYDTEKASIRSH